MTLPDFLTEWPGGEIMLTGHRIGLYSIIRCYWEGYSVEMMSEEFPTLPLALIYKVLGFYLENQTECDRYAAEVAAEIDRQAAMPRKGPTLAELRRRLEAKRNAEQAEK